MIPVDGSVTFILKVGDYLTSPQYFRLTNVIIMLVVVSFKHFFLKTDDKYLLGADLIYPKLSQYTL